MHAAGPVCVQIMRASAVGSTPVGEDLLAGSERATDAFVVAAGIAFEFDGSCTPKASADEELLACEVASLLLGLEPGLGPVHSYTE